MSQTVFIATESGKQEQYSREQVEAIWNTGHLTPETLYWMEGMSEWRPLKELFGTPTGMASSQRPVPPSQLGRETTAFSEYAGFWKRVAAYLIDWIVVIFLITMVSFVVGLIWASALSRLSELEMQTFGSVVGILTMWLYFALMESSAKQATLGKMALSLTVTNLDGGRIGFGRASLRHFGKFISAMALAIGFLMVAFTEKKQGLHDMIAGCLVVK